MLHNNQEVCTMKKNSLVMMSMLVLLNFQIPALASKAFLCTGGIFDKNVGDTDGGECVLYVRHEIQMDGNNYFEVCNGEAWTCYQDAINAGYAVGQTPKVGAIVVFGKSGIYSVAGHVGLVKSVSGSNFVVRESNITYHKVGERTIGNNDSAITGYIYCGGDGSDSEPTSSTLRIVNQLGWYPPTKTCVNADEWVRITNGRADMCYLNNSICYYENQKTLYRFQDILIGSGNLPSSCTQ